MSIEIPKDHPRYESLTMRERLIEGMHGKVVAPAGLIAHGRGEAFDYLLEEKTHPFAENAIEASAALFLLSKHPVISVNGNVASLCPEQLVELSEAIPAPLEINLFYRTPGREEAIYKTLRKAGAEKVLGTLDSAQTTIPELGSERRIVDPNGIAKADTVFVPLEDGDRTKALISMGKNVITVDLNPLSRTSQKASITIVDNIIRAIRLLINDITRLKTTDIAELEKITSQYSNIKTLKRAKICIADYLTGLDSKGKELKYGEK